MSLAPEQMRERQLRHGEIEQQLGRGHVTWHGRFEIEYRTAARAITHSLRENELRILMLGCATGRTVFDALAICSQELKKVQKGTRIKILGIDIAGPAIKFAQNGYFPARRPEARVIPRIYDQMPWVSVHNESSLVIDWEEIRKQGHEVEFREFDIDSGLANLGEPPFHLVEALNSNHVGKDRDIENIGSVLTQGGLVMSGYYYGQPHNVDLDGILDILHSVNDPESLRFIGGLIRAEKPSNEEIGMYGRFNPRRKYHYYKGPLTVKQEIEVYKALDSLGRAALRVNRKSVEEKRAFLGKNPLLTTITGMARHDFFNLQQTYGIQMFERVADPEVKRALHAMHRFAHKELGIPGRLRKLTKFSKRW